ncbi:helix-turn-helix transcriptional regulator [Geoglobus ahangari]
MRERVLKEKEEKILRLLQNGPLTAKQIMQQLGISKQYCYRLLKDLQKKQLIEKKGLEYVITLSGKRAVEETEIKKARVHNIRIVCYVEEADYDKIREIGKEVQMKNWVAYYIDIAELCAVRKIPIVNAKVRINIANTTTAIVHLPEFYASSRLEAETTIQNLFNKVRRILLLDRIAVLDDWINIKYIFGEYAFKTDLPLDPGTEIDLGRKAIDPTGKELPVNAVVKVDDSDGREFESNCAGYTEDVLLSPIRVKETEKAVKRIEEKLDGYDGFLTKLEKAVEKFAEMTEKQAESIEKQTKLVEKQAEVGVIFAENLASHVPYVQSASVALNKITEIAELQQQQQQMFLQAMENQNRMIEVLSNNLTKNGNRNSVLVPFVVFALLLLIAVVKVGLL